MSEQDRKSDMQKVEEMLAKRRAEAFEKATKIPAAEYTGWVSWPGCVGDDGYFESVQELLNHCAKTGKPAPTFVWACKPIPLHLDAEGIVDQALEEHHEGAKDFISNAEMERLQVLLDEWAKAQGVTSWCEDRTRAVMISSP